MVGLTRFELVTPRLSSVCSNQLSYRPDFAKASSGKPYSLVVSKSSDSAVPATSGQAPAGLPGRSAKREGRFSQN